MGLDITVGGVAAVDGGEAASFFSEQTLTEYAGLFSEPEEAVAVMVERLTRQMVVFSAGAELVLLALFRALVAVAYLAALALVAASLAAPAPPIEQRRIPVTTSLGPTFSGLTVDSLLLSDLLDRGIKGITLLTVASSGSWATTSTRRGTTSPLRWPGCPRPGRGRPC